MPKREKNDPEVIEHSADIYGVGADGDVHVLYPPEFKPPQLARGVPLLGRPVTGTQPELCESNPMKAGNR